VEDGEGGGEYGDECGWRGVRTLAVRYVFRFTDLRLCCSFEMASRRQWSGCLFWAQQTPLYYSGESKEFL
jgi:hypothetical protein